MLDASDVTGGTGEVLLLTALSVLVVVIKVVKRDTFMVEETSVVTSENEVGWTGACADILFRELITSPRSSAELGSGSLSN